MIKRKQKEAKGIKQERQTLDYDYKKSTREGTKKVETDHKVQYLQC